MYVPIHFIKSFLLLFFKKDASLPFRNLLISLILVLMDPNDDDR